MNIKVKGKSLGNTNYLKYWKLSNTSAFLEKYFFKVSLFADLLKSSTSTVFKQCRQHGTGRSLQQLGFAPL